MSDYATSPARLPYLKAQYRSSLSIPTGPFYRVASCAARQIERALTTAELDEGEVGPSESTISSIVRIVEDACLPANPSSVSVFHGEAIITWKKGLRELSLLSRGNADDPKLLKYEAGQNESSRHTIQTNVTASTLRETIIHWL